MSNYMDTDTSKNRGDIVKAMTADPFVAPELQPFVEQWGRFAPPMAEAQAITFEQYMAWTPEECNTMELVGGRPLIGGQDDGVERMLAFLMRAFGLAHTLRLGPADLWRKALAPLEVTVPADGWAPLPEPPAIAARDPVLGRRHAASWLLTLTRVGVRRHRRGDTWLIGPFAVRPDVNTILIPDGLYISAERRHLSQGYYLEGAPDWVLEAPWPPGMALCRQQKVPLYVRSGAREVWILDWGRHRLEVYGPSDEQPRLLGKYGPGETVRSTLFDDLVLDVGTLIERGFPASTTSKKEDRTTRLGWRARPELAPQAIDGESFHAWKPQEYHKLEIIEGGVFVGGLVEEAERALAFLLRAVGLRDAVRLASVEEWRRAVDIAMATG